MSQFSKSLLSKYFLLTFFLLVIVVIYLNLNPKPKVTNPSPTLSTKQLTVQTKSKKVVLNVEIAKTRAELTQGLSNRKSLEQNSGMYFELGKRESVTFWMKDMLFPLDIIWIDNNTIVGIEKNAPIPQNNKHIPTFNSEVPITDVLEVNAGFSDKNYIEVGDKITLQ